MTITLATLSIFVSASLLHFIFDFCVQDEWMANNKHKFNHPAGYIHAGMMASLMPLFFPLWAVFVIGVTHFLIDTRIPIHYWIKKTRPNLPNEPWFLYVAITVDQIWHVSIIAILAVICGGSI